MSRGERMTGAAGLIFPARAGLAWAALMLGEKAGAQAHLAEILAYVEGGGVMVDVEIARLPSLHVSRLTRLFDFRRTGLKPEHGFDVSGNGDRILIVREEGASASAGDLTLVTDWRGP